MDSGKIIPKPPFERADFKSKEAVPGLCVSVMLNLSSVFQEALYLPLCFISLCLPSLQRLFLPKFSTEHIHKTLQ